MEEQVVPEPAPASVDPAQDGGLTAPAPDRNRLRRLAWLLPWVAVPLVVIAAYAVLPPPGDLRSQYQGSAVALVVAPLLGWLLTRTSALAHHTAGALAAAVMPGLTLISLHGSEWFLSGPFGDNSFRMEYATRFADDLGSLSDYTYRGVPAFYSPGWFWVVGLSARIAGVPAWQAYKWVAIVTMYLAVAAAFAVWRLTCSRRLAALLTAGATLGLPAAASDWLGHETLLFAGAYEPYGLLVILPLPGLLAWFGAARGPFSWRRGALLGVALAAAAWLYLLYALVGVLAVVVVAAWRWRDRARRAEVATAGLTSMVLVLPWLGLFVLTWVRHGMPPAIATTWVQGDSYVRPFSPAPSPWFALALVGVVGLLVLSGERYRRLRGVQALAVAVLVLGVLQILAGQLARGILFHRLLLLLGVILLSGGILVLAAVWRPLVARLPHPELRHRDLRRLPWRRLAAALLALAFLLPLTDHAAEWMNLRADLRKLAQDVRYPDGRFPVLSAPGTRAELGDEPSVDQLAAAVEENARAAGQRRTGVLLTDDMALLATHPFHGYLQWWALYSNPLGEYPERRAWLEGLEGSSPAEFVRALRANPAAPTVFLLQDGEDGEPTFGSADWNPAIAESPKWSVTLPRELFAGSDFVTTRVGGWTVAALRPGDQPTGAMP